jgi:hypothetical protein
MEMFVSSANKMLSIEFLMLLILLLVIKTINASTIPSSALNDVSPVNNKCEQIAITQHCPELKYNQTMVSNFAHLDINDSIEMVSECTTRSRRGITAQFRFTISSARLNLFSAARRGNNQSASRQRVR